MKITFLVPTAYGMRGDARSTLNLASELAVRHEVEVVSVRRTRETAFFPVDRRVSMRWLVDARPGARHLLPRGQVRIEVALWRMLRGLRADVLVTGRPGLSLQSARHAPRHVVRIAREWGRPSVPGPVRRFYPRLDAVVTSGESSRQEWARLLDDELSVHAIPDPLPAGPWPRSRMDNRIVSAGGRLVPGKSYDRLIRAFAVVADKRPDWRLRLYGSGPEERRLRALVRDLDLHNHVYFMGTTPDLPGEFAKASIVAAPARHEGLGMAVLEALGCGVPIVGFAGSRGSSEILRAGHDSVLVPEGDVESYAGALLALVDDERRRMALAAGALETASAYAAPAVAARWQELMYGLRSRD
ncbi:glycosyltransferase [Microbispora sp. ATCC PTA-5024]|uniref:glycosyltransferase n=1 Tax=Microbispora sp. ATCC PTA-5024 TaxID=316330 RepID=UPI0003DC31BC|nr:glycosyltransferase [Microbispora sp. ATCC PTA-5024]ETK35403.1 glycosyl transferase family 1 [Microbispora sp. ATCC PTA-5024]